MRKLKLEDKLKMSKYLRGKRSRTRILTWVCLLCPCSCLRKILHNPLKYNKAMGHIPFQTWVVNCIPQRDCQKDCPRNSHCSSFHFILISLVTRHPSDRPSLITPCKTDPLSSNPVLFFRIPSTAGHYCVRWLVYCLSPKIKYNLNKAGSCFVHKNLEYYLIHSRCSGNTSWPLLHTFN